MTGAIAHRGPDGEGVYISPDKKVGLANRRLAIVDLSSRGSQPMSYLDRYWITYNGEVYNFRDVRAKLEKEGVVFKTKTDTEVILALYHKYKLNFLKYLRGMFAFALYDTKENTLILARDRIGKKPLKYWMQDGLLIFASELKAILTQKEVTKAPDWEAIHHYLSFGYVPAPMTGFVGIQKLEPGHYLYIDLKKGRISKQKDYRQDY